MRDGQRHRAHGHGQRAARSGDEVLVRPGAVEVGRADRVARRVGPVQPLRVAGQSVGLAGAGDEVVADDGTAEVGLRDRARPTVGPEDVRTGDRDPDRAVDTRRLKRAVRSAPVEVGPADRPEAHATLDVGPVHVPGVDRDPVRDVGGGDEVLVDPGPVQVGLADRAAPLGVGPVDVLPVDGETDGGAAPGDEVLVDAGAVEVGATDGAAAGVRPVDVLPVDRHPLGRVGSADEVGVRVAPVEVGHSDRAGGAVRPIDTRRHLSLSRRRCCRHERRGATGQRQHGAAQITHSTAPVHDRLAFSEPTVKARRNCTLW